MRAGADESAALWWGWGGLEQPGQGNGPSGHGRPGFPGCRSLLLEDRVMLVVACWRMNLTLCCVRLLCASACPFSARAALLYVDAGDADRDA